VGQQVDVFVDLAGAEAGDAGREALPGAAEIPETTAADRPDDRPT